MSRLKVGDAALIYREGRLIECEVIGHHYDYVEEPKGFRAYYLIDGNGQKHIAAPEEIEAR